MELQLRGKRVLITGASEGIGLGVAKGFAAEGAHLHLTSRSLDKLQSAKAEIAAMSDVEVSIHAHDLIESSSVDALVQACPQIDILVNNAGGVPGGDILNMDEPTWRKVWDLKVYSYINLAREFYRQMQQRNSGVIINVAGAAGDRPGYGFLAGSTADAALMTLARGMGSRSIDSGVRVLTVNPGGTETPRLVGMFKARAERELGDGERWRELTTNSPLGRLAQPEEVADLVVFLASERASYINATVITIDGGLSYR